MKVYNYKRSHWITGGPLGGSVEWNADIVEDRENELISWTSVKGADVANSGSVHFSSEWGFVRIMPYKAHLVIDTLVGVLAIGSSWLFGFADNAFLRNTFLVIGAFGVSAGLLSQPEEIGSKQSDLSDNAEHQLCQR